jgi:hypothetical protein
MNPITEDDIANYLANTPDFFERHAQLLAQVQLTSPHGNRAVSLQERQAEMLREKIKALEHRIMDMVRHGNENVVIADRMQRWTKRPADHARPAQPAVPHRGRPAVAVPGAADGHQGVGLQQRVPERGLRPVGERRREGAGHLADLALLRAQLGLRGGQLAARAARRRCRSR